MLVGSVQAVRKGLKQIAAGLTPEDADGTLASHVAELERRVHRLNGRGGALASVRLSKDLLELRAAVPAAV